MILRRTKIQLLAFVVITLLGITYVSAEYVGLGKYLTGNHGCQVQADFPDSGGIFTNAEVTYRGVTVGRVGALNLISNGVRVDLNLNNCSSPQIPKDSAAIIADRSVIGEQYVNLVPPHGGGPYIAAGDRIPMSRNRVPLATQTLLVNINKFVTSLNLGDLRTTVSELGQAFNRRGEDIGRLLDATRALLQTASTPQNVAATQRLIDDSSGVLQTQLDETQPLQDWTHSLRLLSGQLKQSNPDFVRLLTDGPRDLGTVTSFIRKNRTDFGVTLADLTTIGRLLVRYRPGLEEVFELYPALAAGGQSVLQDKQGFLGQVINQNLPPAPQDCADPQKGGEGYGGTVRRQPGNTAPIAPNTSARCTAPTSSGKSIRGSAHVPGGDPISNSGGGRSYPRASTADTLQVGPSLAGSEHLSDGSWLGLLTDALH